MTGLLKRLSTCLAGKPSRAHGQDSSPYEFSSDWFSHKIPHWSKILAEFRDRPDLRYLEIGVFEGRSLVWMLDHVLTHSTATAVAVDIFVRGYRERLERNLGNSGGAGKTEIIDGPGEEVMKSLHNDSFHIIYLDGGHAAWTVYQQAAAAWLLLKEHGLLIFDDYSWHVDDYPADLAPTLAIDSFISCFWQQLDVLHKGEDVFVRKKRRRCGEYYCTPITDRFVYHWRERRLLRTLDASEVLLSEHEKTALERLLLGSGHAFNNLLLDPAFAQLVRILQSEG